MRKLSGILLLAIFVFSFVAGIMISSAEATPPCTAACINGQLRVCCFVPGQGFKCNFV